jgi:dTDP-L-rhamnose 4-epimerase
LVRSRQNKISNKRNSSQEQILVTGGAGFIGSHLVDALIEKGYWVRVLDNLEPQVHGDLNLSGHPPIFLNPEAEFIFGDVRDPDIVSKALQDIDVVFHQAAMVGVGQSMYAIPAYTSVNAYGTAILLQAIVDSKNRPRKMIVASSMSIYGEGAYFCPDHGEVYPQLRSVHQLQKQEWEPRCPSPGCEHFTTPLPTKEDKPLFPTSIYAINKRDQEEMFLATGIAYNIPTVALRYFNTYGSRQALNNPYTGVAAIFSNRLLNGKTPIVYEDGRQLRDFTHVSDIVQANLIVMNDTRADYKVFNVGTGRAVSIADVACALIDHFDQHNLITGSSHDKNENPSTSKIKATITGQFRAGDIRHCTADITHIKALGYQPKVRFEDGIAGLVEWVQSQVQISKEDHFDHAQQELSDRGLTV